MGRGATTKSFGRFGSGLHLLEAIELPPFSNEAVHVWVIPVPSLTLRGSPIVESAPSAGRAHGTQVPMRSQLVRRVVARYLARPWPEIQIDRSCQYCGHGEHGRPRLRPKTGIEFSVSRTTGHVVVAVCARGPVGVDAEYGRGNVGELRAALTEAEQAATSARPVGREEPEGIRLWTRKEAVCKATGLGLSLDPLSFEVHPAGWVSLKDARLRGALRTLYVSDVRTPEPALVVSLATASPRVVSILWVR